MLEAICSLRSSSFQSQSDSVASVTGWSESHPVDLVVLLGVDIMWYIALLLL